MKFLAKNTHSRIVQQDLSYAKQSDRPAIRQILKAEQQGFCAYSERYLQNTDEVHIEHFDGRLKNTDQDSYHNWYAVLARINTTKAKKIKPFLPILSPSNDNLGTRIHYTDKIFQPLDKEDIEADNLIKYLGFNKYELTTDRNNHIQRILYLKAQLEDDFEDFLQNHPQELSFITALEVELDMPLEHLLPTPPHTN